MSAQIHAPGDVEPFDSSTPPPRQAPVNRNILAPRRLGVSDEIAVLPLQQTTRPTARSQDGQRRFPPNPHRPTSALASFQPPLGQIQGLNTKDSLPPVEKIPPVVLREKTRWGKLSVEIKRRGINFDKAQNISLPSTATDYRPLTKFFLSDSIPHHTYQLPSEKLLNVVLREVPVEISEEEVYNNLREYGFTPDVL